MKKHWICRIVGCASAILLLIICNVFVVYAGFGDYNDYDSGDSGYSSGSYDYSSGDGGGDASPGLLIAEAVIITGVLIFINVRNKQSDNTSTRNIMSSAPMTETEKATILKNRTGEITGIIQKRDPNFSSDVFIAYVKKVYIEI